MNPFDHLFLKITCTHMPAIDPTSLTITVYHIGHLIPKSSCSRRTASAQRDGSPICEVFGAVSQETRGALTEDKKNDNLLT